MNIPFIDLFKSKEPINQLKYSLPYSFIMDNGICLLKNAALMTTYQVSYPDLESSSAPEIANMAELFNRSAMTLACNEGWALFFDVKRYKTKNYPMGKFDNLAGWLIDQRRADNYQSFGEHYNTDYYISFVYQLPSDVNEKATSIFFKKEKKNNSNKSLFQKSKNLPIIQKEIDNFVDECEKTMGALASKLWIHRLSNCELFSYIKSEVSLINQNLVFPKDTFFFLDNYLTDMDIHNSMPLKIGENYVPIISVMDLPNKTYPAIFDGLNRTMLEFRWTTRFIPISKENSLKEVDKYQKRMYSSRKSAATLITELAADVTIDRENQGAVALENEANELQANITVGDYVLGYYTSSLMCWDKKIEIAKEKSRRLQQVIRACGFTSKEETLNNFNAWLGMMPGNVYSNVRRPLINTKNFSHIIPLSSAWQGQKNNAQMSEWCGSGIPLCICSTSYGTPFFLNLNVKDVGNTFIFGPVGSGKSTLIATLMASATKYKNANVICIDKQLSSRAFIVASGGIYVEPGKDAVTFQPLSELKNPKLVSDTEFKESIMWCEQFIEGLLSQQNITCTTSMQNSITQTLNLLAEKSDEQHDLTSFQQYVNYSDPHDGSNTIRDALNPYCKGGTFGSIFDSDKTTLNLSKIMTIEMGSLMRLSEKAVAPALMYIFRYLEKIWNIEHGKRQPVTFLFLDEAWLYLQNPIFANYLQEWLRTLRKKRVFCIFATQEVSAAANSPLRETIAQQCLTKIYLADESASTPALASSYRYFGLTDSEISALSNATMKKDYYFKNPRGCRMFSLDLDDFQLALLSTDHELIDKVEDTYGKNTTTPLAFELLDATKEKYISLGKDPKLLDYSIYKKILGDK